MSTFDMPVHAMPLHEVSPPCADEPAGDTRLPQVAEGTSEEYGI